MLRFRNIIGFTCVLLAGQAGTALGDSFSPYGAVTHIFDDNILNTADDDEARAQLGTDNTAEHALRMEGGLDIDLDISRQTIFFRSNINRTVYDRLSDLDFTGFNFQTGVNWGIGRNCSGTGDVQWVRTAGSFNEFTELRLNEKNRKVGRLSAACFVSSSVRVRGEGAYSDSDNSADNQKNLNRLDAAVEGGADYITSGGTLVGLTGRVRDTKFPKRRDIGSTADKRHQQYFLGVNFEWSPRRALRLSGLGGWTTRKHESVTGDDFDDFNGNINADWAVTSTITLGSSLFYEVGGTENLTASATRDEGFDLDAVWQATPRIRTFGNFGYTETDFLITSGANNNRKDETFDWGLGIIYEVLRFAEISLEYRGRSRDSSTRLSEYDDNIVETQVRLQF